ncbi:hypothetical protein IX329_001001 [Fusobacterium necrophorum]|nr:hypothetical protein [Fusobacterium necrophorum]MBR8733427.1 hypothetical protein [Fusobacterium necrophorum]MBR8789604.1 hypothetical protein [Fusobacterium necrophorum]
MKKEIILEKDISEGIVERSYNREQTIKIVSLEEEIQDKEIPYIKKEKKFLAKEMEKESKSKDSILELNEKKALEITDMNGDFIPDDQNIRDEDLRIREKRKRKIKKRKKQKELEGGKEIKYF